jgi:hypothetical protein
MKEQITGRDGKTYTVHPVNGNVKLPDELVKTGYYSDNSRLRNKRYDVEKLRSNQAFFATESEIFSTKNIPFDSFWATRRSLENEQVKNMVFDSDTREEAVKQVEGSPLGHPYYVEAAGKFYDAVQPFRHSVEACQSK